MMALPFVFVLFVIRFPAGLLVYWITTNLWTVGQQYVIRRKLGHQTGAGGDAAPPAVRRAGATTAPERLRQRVKEKKESKESGTPAAVAAGPARTAPPPAAAPEEEALGASPLMGQVADTDAAKARR